MMFTRSGFTAIKNLQNIYLLMVNSPLLGFSNVILFFSCYPQGEDRELLELAPLCVTYFIVFLYLAFSVGKLKISVIFFLTNYFNITLCWWKKTSKLSYVHVDELSWIS